MANSKEVRLENSNLRFCGTKMDTNGNGCYLFKYPNSRVFSIQAHNFWNGSHFRLVKDPAAFFSKYGVKPADLEKEAIGYISVFGSKKQKEGLKIFKK